MKIKAFTLAETLITLGIIGIVAAMTLPSLTNKLQKKDKSARLKKFNSAINQAITRSIADNGEPQYWYETPKYHDSTSLYNWFDKYIMNYMIIVKNCRNSNAKCSGEYNFCKKPNACYGGINLTKQNVLYIFGDGSMIIAITGGGVNSETGNTTSMTLHIRFDTNGYKKPNTLGMDIFSFRMDINKNFHYITCDNHKSETGGTVSLSGKRKDLVSACKTDPQTCSCLLMYDGFEFKNDYPW